MPLSVILVHPEIPPNTGNIIRLCANTGSHLHLVRPLGFALDNARMRRAGLDYHEIAILRVHDTLEAALAAARAQADKAAPPGNLYALATQGRTRYDQPKYARNDIFLFGGESRGLPAAIRARIPPARQLFIPMRPKNRSLNLSNAAAVTLMEAWRQLNFEGADASNRSQ